MSRARWFDSVWYEYMKGSVVRRYPPWQKPPRGALLNRSHDLARGLIEGFLLNEFTGRPFPLFGVAPYTGINSAPYWIGDGLYFDGTDDRITYSSDYLAKISTATFVTVYRLYRSNSGDGIWGMFSTTPSFRYGGLWTGTPSYRPTFFRYAGGIYREVYVTGSAADYDGTPNFCACRCTQGGKLEIFHGKLHGGSLSYAISSTNYTYGTPGANADDLAFGDYNSAGGQESQTTLIYWLAYNRLLSNDEIKFLHQQPYGMFL